MEGKVKIIVKDSNGNIVKEVNQKNKIFDMPKNVFSEMFPMTIQNYYRYSTTTSLSSTSIEPYAYLNFIGNIRDWFRSIRLNDERYTEQDGQIVDSAYKDWKLPQLVGGDNSSLADTSNWRYVFANTGYSTETGGQGTIKHLYYSWNMPRPVDQEHPQTLFYIKSLALGHYDTASRNFTDVCNNIVSFRGNYSSYTRLMWKYGNFYFGSTSSSEIINTTTGEITLGNYYAYNTLYKNPTYRWNFNRFTYTKQLQVNTNTSSKEGCSIYPLYNNEILLLRYTKDVISDNNNSSSYVKYITIIDNDSGNIKRQFILDQFNDSGRNYYQQYYSPNYNQVRYVATTCFNVVSTPTKNYLIEYSLYDRGVYNNTPKTNRFTVWEIPNQTDYTTMLTEDKIKIPCVASASTDTECQAGKSYYTREYNYSYAPGYLTDEFGYRYTLVSSPSGNPQSKGYYEIASGNEGIDGEGIDIINIVGDSDTLATFNSRGSFGYIYQSYPINNYLILCNYILKFEDNQVTLVDRHINNSTSTIGEYYYSVDSNYLGRTCIPGLYYGISDNNSGGNYPIWYNSSCINLDDDIEIKEGNTLTVEYTITAN